MLSVTIIAKNEEHNIRRCLASVQWADEIIVLDSGSNDRTVEIAREFTDKVFCTDWRGYGVQKQRALERATGDWVLNLDADESVDEALKQKVLEIIQDKPSIQAQTQLMDAYRIPIQMIFCGQPLRYSASPSRHVRLYRRAIARYSDDIVHEKIILPATALIGQLKTPLWHHSFQDISHMLTKLNRYSSYSAQIRLEQKKTGCFLKALLGPIWMFIRCYIFQRGFLDGKIGLIFAIYKAEGTFYREMKVLYPDVSQPVIMK